MKVGDGGYATEAELHRMYGEHRVHGEWFTPNEILTTEIGILNEMHQGSELDFSDNWKWFCDEMKGLENDSRNEIG